MAKTLGSEPSNSGSSPDIPFKFKVVENYKLYRVVLSYACYAILVRDGRLIESAPIAEWALGRKLEWFSKWVTKKGGYLHEVMRL